MQKLLSPLILATALVAGLSAPCRADDATTVKTLLDQMRQAAGGERWASVMTLHIVGKSTGGVPKVIDQWQDVGSGRYRLRYSGDWGTAEGGFDGISSWQQPRDGIAYTMGDVDSALVAADESFRVAQAWWFGDRHPATIAYAGVRSEKDRSFDVLDITPEGGRLFEAWIDRSTHLLDRIDEQQAEERVVIRYSDYRSVDGLMIPFTVRSGDGDHTDDDDVETVQTVDINSKIPDDLYAVPPLPASDITLPAGRDSVEVPFHLAANNRIMVPVTLNGNITVEAEFDSGGSLLLQPATVAKLGVASGGHAKAGGGGEGTVPASLGRLDSLKIGDAEVKGLSFDSFTFHPDAPDEALVGLEILQRFVVRFDFDRQVMTLTRPDAFHYEGSGAIVPFHFQDNQPEVKGAIDGVAGLFAIDTGDNSSLLLIAPFARRYGLVERYHADIPYEGQATGTTHGVWARQRAGTVTLDGADGRPIVEAHDPVTRISLQHSGFDANRNVSANIGLGILKQFNLTFDYRHQRLILERNHLYGQFDIFSRTGFAASAGKGAKDKGWTIQVVYPDSPASEAGLKPGDTILAIDGHAPGQVSDDALAAIVKGPVGSTVVVQVKSASRPKTVRLVLRDVL